MGNAKLLQRSDVFDHTGETDDGELLDFESSGITLAVNKVIFEVAGLGIEA